MHHAPGESPEFNLDGNSPGHQQVLSEMKETGYNGTELGSWGIYAFNCF